MTNHAHGLVRKDQIAADGYTGVGCMFTMPTAGTELTELRSDGPLGWLRDTAADGHWLSLQKPFWVV